MSSHSARSTPPAGGTPPHLAESFVSFDYVRPSRAPAAVQLDPVDFASRTLRQVTLLRTAPGSSLGRPEPMEPRLSNGPVRGPPARLTSATFSTAGTASTSLGSLYPLLKTNGDAQYKLPPLQHRYPSSSSTITPTMSPVSRASTISPPPSMDMDEDYSSGSPTPEPPQIPMLPGIRTLTREVGRIALKAREVPEADRSRHAELLRDMLVTVNSEYRRRYGTPPSAHHVYEVMERARTMSPSRDVEMVAAC